MRRVNNVIISSLKRSSVVNPIRSAICPTIRFSSSLKGNSHLINSTFLLFISLLVYYFISINTIHFILFYFIFVR